MTVIFILFLALFVAMNYFILGIGSAISQAQTEVGQLSYHFINLTSQLLDPLHFIDLTTMLEN